MASAPVDGALASTLRRTSKHRRTDPLCRYLAWFHQTLRGLCFLSRKLASRFQKLPRCPYIYRAFGFGRVGLGAGAPCCIIPCNFLSFSVRRWSLYLRSSLSHSGAQHLIVRAARFTISCVFPHSLAKEPADVAIDNDSFQNYNNV